MLSNLTQKDRKYMLIIDDDFINREVLKNIFSTMFCFHEAGNGLEGLQKVQAHADELGAILLDVQMPEMDGMALLEILYQRGIPSQIPVFLITSTDELDIARSAYDMGVMGIINKPVVPFIVQRRVQLVTELYQAREALNVRVEHQEQKLQENVQTIDALHRNTLEALASAIEFRDVESGEHTNRIYGITKSLLRDTPLGAGFTPEEIENMAIGSIMHDVGKIAISDVVLNKPGKLTKAEFETMKTHTVKGADLLEQLNKVRSHPSYRYALDIARHHHERWDGRGYPDGLKGAEITVWSQAVSIADVYDALVSPRVYKKAFSPDKAVEMIKNGECGCFNPQLVDCFLQIEPRIRQMYRANPPADPSGEESSSKELIDVLLMASVVQTIYDLIVSVNLSRGDYHIVRNHRFLPQSLEEEGSLQQLLEAAGESVPESHRQEYLRTFSPENLQRVYGSGQRALRLRHPGYADDGSLQTVTTGACFMEDPKSGDIRLMLMAAYHRN